MRRLALLLLLATGCAATRPVETTTLQGAPVALPDSDRQEAGSPPASPFNGPQNPASGVSRSYGADTVRAHLEAEPTPPVTTVRLQWTMPDSVEFRRGCGWSRADSSHAAHSDMRAEVWIVPRFGPPYWPPVYRESLLVTTGWRAPGSAVDTIISTPGHGVLFVRARNALGGAGCRSNLTDARVSE